MVNGKIVFFGTAEICIPYLKELVKNYDVKLIITQPDKKGGRKNKLISSPVKTFAIENNIRYIQPKDFNSEVRDIINSIAPDISIVIAYGQKIPKDIFQIPFFNTINVHFSLLPKYRGAAPVQRAIERGDKKTGVTIFEISRKMDAGKIWAKEEFEILDSDTTKSLWDKLSDFSTPILIDTLKKIFKGSIEKLKQKHSEATYAPPISKSEGEINWDLQSKEIVWKLRAFNPWPGIFFLIKDKKFKIISAESISATTDKTPGNIIKLDKSGLYIACGNNTVLKINILQPEGKKPMTPYNYSLGNKIIN